MATAIPAGTTAYAATASGTYQFVERYGYVQVQNTGTTIVYASADPGVTTPSASTENTVMVPAGGTAVLDNRNPLWFQSSNILRAGTLIYPTGGGTPQTNTTPNGQPGTLQNQQTSLAGQLANPGTTVSISAPSASATVFIAAAG